MHTLLQIKVVGTLSVYIYCLLFYEKNPVFLNIYTQWIQIFTTFILTNF